MSWHLSYTSFLSIFFPLHMLLFFTNVPLSWHLKLTLVSCRRRGHVKILEHFRYTRPRHVSSVTGYNRLAVITCHRVSALSLVNSCHVTLSPPSDWSVVDTCGHVCCHPGSVMATGGLSVWHLRCGHSHQPQPGLVTRGWSVPGSPANQRPELGPGGQSEAELGWQEPGPPVAHCHGLRTASTSPGGNIRRLYHFLISFSYISLK